MEKRSKCYNCKHAGDQFKIGTLTHLHCRHPDWDKQNKVHPIAPWDTLQMFSDTCKKHEFKYLVTN